MAYFSEKVKEIFVCEILEGNIEKMKRITSELTNPQDRMLGNCIIAGEYITQGKINEFNTLLREIEDWNRDNNNIFINYCIYLWNYLLQDQFHFNDQLRKKFRVLLEKTYLQINQLNFEGRWVKFLVEGSYNFLYLGNQIGRSREELEMTIVYRKRGLGYYSKITDKGGEIVDMLSRALGAFYFLLGDIEKAERVYLKSLKVGVKYDNPDLIICLRLLTRLYFHQDKLTKAHEFNDQALNAAKKFNDIFEIFFALTNRAECYFREGKYEESLLSYQQSLEYRLKYNQTTEIFRGYLHLLFYHYERYRLTKDKQFLIKSTKILPKLEEIQRQNKENSLIKFNTRLSQALILKHGSFKKKGQAVDKFRQLLREDMFPIQHMEVSMHLLDLLFENVTISEDEDIIEEIDKLMEQISEFSLSENVNTTFFYISQQILLARYQFYIKNNGSKAIEILTAAKEHMHGYKFHIQKETIGKELELFSRTIKDQMDEFNFSQFRTYLQDALDLARQQPSN